MRPIIKWTLWQRRISTIWWSVGAFGLIFINMVFYPTFKDQAAELEKSFESLPDAAVQLFGGSTDFFSPVGFLNSQIFFLMLPMILAILAIGLGSSLLGREEEDLTIEPLLARPISRSKLLLAKAISGIIVLSVVTLVALLTTVITGKVVELDVPLSNILLATFACFLLVLSLGAVAYLLSSLGRARSASIGIAAFVALGGYLISSLSETVNWLSGPSKIFPFHYYSPEQILRGNFDWANVIFPVALTIICAALAWVSFRRRDIA